MKLENFKLYRWFHGGTWVLLTDAPCWLRALWVGRERLFLYDETGRGYARNDVRLIAIEDYT